MESVILVIHLFLALAIIGLVLIQRSEGGGLGIGGGGGGMGKLASAQGTGNFLAKATAYCAAAFFCTSLILAILAGQRGKSNEEILNALDEPAEEMIISPEEGELDLPAVQGEANKEEPSAPVAE